ncbi:MAG TPA: hypothetical protein VK983_05155 [Candidatus Limnocylindrales bacterium]|nr:hypothetical protein [Candidatus Limnocylindrales bacterium]
MKLKIREGKGGTAADDRTATREVLSGYVDWRQYPILALTLGFGWIIDMMIPAQTPNRTVVLLASAGVAALATYYVLSKIYTRYRNQ